MFYIHIWRVIYIVINETILIDWLGCMTMGQEVAGAKVAASWAGGVTFSGSLASMNQ